MAWTLLGGAIFLAWSIDAAIGFGSLVIALTLGALVLPLDQIMPVLVPLNIILSGYLSFRYHRYIDWQLFFKGLMVPMLLGSFVGLQVIGYLNAEISYLLFGSIVVWFAARSLWYAYQPNAELRAHPAWLTPILTFAAGMTHGMFASGGPLLVYALTGIAMAKQTFRATLSLIWFLLNLSLTIWFVWSGRFFDHSEKTLVYVPVVLAAIVFGEWLHHRVSEGLFRKIVLWMLLVAGVLLLVK